MKSIEQLRFNGFRQRYKCFGTLLLVLLMIAAAAPNCRAQTWAEIFKQNKTQRKYLLNQIAALQVYIGYAKKGYELVGSGIGTIRDLSRGEFDLHTAFITGLKQVSPLIRNDARVAEIITLQLSVMKSFGGIKSGQWLSADQLFYVAEVTDVVLGKCYHDLEELLLVITAAKLEMKDDERLKRLEGIHERMLDKYAFAQSFSREAGLLIRQKQLEQNTVEKLRRYYEIE